MKIEIKTIKIENYEVKGKTRYKQTAYAYLGGDYPSKISLPIDSPAQMYQQGFYSLAQESFEVGDYDSLRINPFRIKLESIQSQSEEPLNKPINLGVSIPSALNK